MAQAVKNADALAETLASIPSIHVRQLITSVFLVPGNLTPSSGLLEYCTHAEHIRGWGGAGTYTEVCVKINSTISKTSRNNPGARQGRRSQ